ncbi:UvrB/UvrC motif-containing protein [Paenibacillus sp. SC116]|uniref:UvrB/UvrC motif-containing protein n=1 Tax=Paenibacillus sp. SC116 TaxID=2968986 RepID=UPI00215A8383|nr:UvrB/UvrC motif-containing protein [Paenibacillus sp. SC116]MCR8846675.1 UvrB/UvrC motif-containing protein [Paenibacillus sp. SC116]
MMCQQCGQKSATLHFTKIINGEKTEFHICESCAREKGELIPGAPNGFSIHNLLSGLLDFDMTNGNSQLQSGLYGVKSTQEVMRCDHCGLTFSQFSKMGRFGCDACYNSFASRLDPLLKRVHGSIVHVGKIPKRNGIVMQRKRELIVLREKLQLSIQLEQFETAAQLRDEIRKIEQDLSGGAEAK